MVEVMVKIVAPSSALYQLVKIKKPAFARAQYRRLCFLKQDRGLFDPASYFFRITARTGPTELGSNASPEGLAVSEN
jgi:hypothetical protein